MTPHINAKINDIAKTVIMPGDPLRAKVMTEKFLDNYKLVSSVRGMLAYTGFYKGHPVTIMASGMGMPSMGIYAHELYNFYNVDNIIRVGSMGAYTSDLKLFDIVLATSSFSKSSFAKIYLKEDINILEASTQLVDLIKYKANQLSIPLKTGRVYSSDVFYSEEDINLLHKNNLCLGVEMETFALFATARKNGKKAASLLTVSDNLVTKEETSAEDRQNKFVKMFELALETCIKD